MNPAAKLQEPRFRPAYMAPLKRFFQIMDEDEAARREFLQDAGNAMKKYGLKDLPAATIQGHADTAQLRTLVLPPVPPAIAASARANGYGVLAAEAARASLLVVHLGRTDVMLWVSLVLAYWRGKDPEDMAPWDRIMLESWRQPPLRTRLLTDPAAVLTEYGMQIPPGVKIRMVEQSFDVIHLVLPPMGSFATLSFEDFEELTSGWQWWRTLGVPRLCEE